MGTQPGGVATRERSRVEERTNGAEGDYGDRIQRAVRAQIRAEIAAYRPKMSQNEVARKAGMNQSTLSRYLSDEEDRGLPYSALSNIARALGLTPVIIAQRAEERLRGEERHRHQGGNDDGGGLAAAAIV